MDGPRKRSGPATTGPPRSAAAKQANTRIVPDPWGVRSQARERLQNQGRHRRIAWTADELMPLAVYYGPRTPRPVPLGRFLVEGWWAA
jgi:hypothetical protein